MKSFIMITKRRQLKKICKWLLVLLLIRLILNTVFNFYFGKDVLEICLVDGESNPLTEKVACLRNHKCPQWGTPYANTSHLIVCNKHISPSSLLLMTTMYGKDNMFIFDNTLHVWYSMAPKLHPVLFIDSVESFIKENKTHFLQKACDMGWTVAMAPLCNEHQFPVFKQLFVSAMEQWDAPWYGYANGDMLFDDSLLDSLEFLTKHKEIFKTSMVVGRRYDLSLKVNQRVQKPEISQKFPNTSMADSAMVDYFLTMHRGFPWQDIPDFVIGRPGYDTWLLWLINALKMHVVDTTTSIRAVHQVIQGLTENENSHKAHKVQAGMLYNEELAAHLRNTRNLRLVRGLGYLSCVPHKLAKMSTLQLKKMVADATGPLIEVIGRGHDFLPINGFQDLVQSDTAEKKEPEQKQVMDNVEDKINNSTLKKSHITRKLLAYNNTHVPQSSKNSKERNVNFMNQTSHLLRNTNTSMRGRSGNFFKNSLQQNDLNTQRLANEGQLTKHKNVTEVEAQSPESHWYALNPSIPVSFIPDSSDFQYVLIKRTKYYRKLQNNKGFKQVFQNLHGACYDNQHIDLEVGDLVIY